MELGFTLIMKSPSPRQCNNAHSKGSLETVWLEPKKVTSCSSYPGFLLYPLLTITEGR